MKKKLEDNLNENLDYTKANLVFIILAIVLILFFVLVFYSGFIIGTASNQEQCNLELRQKDIVFGWANNATDTYFPINATHYRVEYDKPKWSVSSFSGNPL